ncbi:MAG TPA: hypothetical protein VN754_02680 [Candidatus Binataceae bacterium]|nr:hypothetical protein [Candidatus Binataceae bacterium]
MEGPGAPSGGAVAAYIEQLGPEAAKPAVKQHLAAIRQLFDYLNGRRTF